MTIRSGIIFIDKSPILTDPQILVISELLRNTGLLIFGATIVPYILNAVDKPSFIAVIWSLVLTLLFWTAAIVIVRKIHQI